MKHTLLLLILVAGLASCQHDNDPRLVIITLDGLRWQELFTGADSLLLSNPKYVADTAAMTDAYWRPSAEERRAALMPFTWSYIAQHGYLIGNRLLGSQMQVANAKNYSYPGYSEMFCGYADDKRIDSNDPVPNPNTSVLEVANQDPRYHGRVMMYGSWLSTRFAVNNERGGFPASAAYEPHIATRKTEILTLLDEMQQGMPRVWDSERYDAFTYAYAVETMRTDHPKVMWISLGETDEWAHDGQYDKYLLSATANDFFIRRIVERCEADPFYRGRTTYLLTTDHGRGLRRSFSSHGSAAKGSNETWFAAFGAGIEPLGETANNGPFFTQQLAATIAQVLGLEFTPDNGEATLPFDPHFSGVPIIEEEDLPDFGEMHAVWARPTGKGLRFTYYEGVQKSVSELRKLPVRQRGTLPNFIISQASARDHFGYIYRGLLRIPSTGRYILSSTSDDGSQVWLNRQLVIDNDGSHSAATAQATGILEEGYHRIEVAYFDDHEGEELELTIEGEGMNEQPIPDDMLFYE